jgi:hypothetical protein
MAAGHQHSDGRGDRFTPIAVLVMLLMDVLLNSLLEPVSAHLSVVILLTCLQVSVCSKLGHLPGRRWCAPPARALPRRRAQLRAPTSSACARAACALGVAC